MPFALSNALAATAWYALLEQQLGLARMAGHVESASLARWLPLLSQLGVFRGAVSSPLRPSHPTASTGTTTRISQVPLGGLALGVATCLSAPLCWPAAIRLCWPDELRDAIFGEGDDVWPLVDLYWQIAIPVGLPVALCSGVAMQALPLHPPRQRAGHPPRPGFARPPRPAPPCCCCADVPSTWQALLGPLLLGTASSRPWTSTALPALAALACATLMYVSRCRPALDDSFWIERISPRGELYSANVRTGAVSAGGARAHAASETRALLRALREVQTPLIRRFINRLRGTSTANEERGCAGMGVRIVGDCAQPDVRLSAVRAHADALLVVDCLVREQVIDI